MTQTDFFNKTRDILLFKDNSGIFRYRLKKALDEYSKVAKEASVKPEVLSDIHYISQRLKEIVSNYEKGLQSKAYSQLQNLIQGNKKIAPKIDLAKTILPFDAGKPLSFYRIRVMDYVYKIEPKEMFHIPLDMRGIVKTQRYSTSGYPCLYLGESIYGCWEEMRRPPMIKCAVSRLECSLKLNIVDLSIPSEIDMTNPAYQRLIPLIISCMVPVENHNDTYKPEYIIPQLIIEWVLKNRNKGIDGVCYTSTHMSDDFDFPEDKMLNYAIPIYDTDPRHRYCKKLCSMFKVTKPTTNEIEQLKIGYDINIGTYGGSIDDIKRERYENSNFGNLEKRLNDKRKFPLTQILYKG